MKAILLAVVVAAASLTAPAASTGATTNWVAQFVREYVGNALSNSTAVISANSQAVVSNGTTSATFYAGGYEIKFVFETPDQPALSAKNCGPAAQADGVTNGYLWAWSEDTGKYVNVTGFPIIPSPTNFTYKGVSSVERDGSVYLKTAGGSDYCEVLFTQIQKSKADALKGDR